MNKRLLLATGLLLGCALAIQKIEASYGASYQATTTNNKKPSVKRTPWRHKQKKRKFAKRRKQHQRARAQQRKNRAARAMRTTQEQQQAINVPSIERREIWRIPAQGTIEQSMVTPNDTFIDTQKLYLKLNPNSLLINNFSETESAYSDRTNWEKPALTELCQNPELMATVQEMHLDGMETITTFFNANLSHFTHLESLTLQGVGFDFGANQPTSLTDNQVQKLQQLTSLKSLHLENCPNIQSIMSNLPSTLERLILINCNLVTLPANLPINLKVLALNYISDWHPTTLPACITALPQLEELHVYGADLQAQPVTNASGRPVTVYWERAPEELVIEKLPILPRMRDKPAIGL